MAGILMFELVPPIAIVRGNSRRVKYPHGGGTGVIFERFIS